MKKKRGENILRQAADGTHGSRSVLPFQEIGEPYYMTEQEKCLLCGSALKVVLGDLVDTRFGTPESYEVRRCVQCDLEQTYPAPTLLELKNFYETRYNFGGENGTLYTKLRERFFFSFVNRLWSQLDGDISFYQRRGCGRLLDVGCNEGRGLRIYMRNGFQVEGLELNETAASVAREAGFAVHTCLLEKFEPVSSYNVVVLANVLEHSLNPLEMLRDARRILATGGQIWISCPNSQSWLRGVFGRSWINWHVPFHIFHFNSETLQRLLADAGYVDIEVKQITPALWVAGSLITYIFARKGRKTRQLRNPLWVGFLMVFARFVLFPALWLGNRWGRGDCLLAIATKV
jgi:SAM-dependent methyltransferase